MIKVYTVRPDPSGGYERDPEGIDFRDLDTVQEYVDFLQEALPALHIDEGAAVETAARLPEPEAGMVLAWREPDGSVQRQLVCED
jgi:hypothetical protein